ncbi:MAG: Rrf2 family transcriptional regulator [candidate division Zixibacteria bacterium]|nr:Rrf2 family transcriptional regulator [candidate division Zixibacteria bacterium]
MKLTTRSEYALLALLYLARHYSQDYVTVETVAAAQIIPHKYLEQIMLALKRARYVKSSKGQRGGYRLAKPADAINLAEIIRLFDGALAPTDSVSEYFYGTTPVEKEGKLVAVLRNIRDFAAQKLESTTLADVS